MDWPQLDIDEYAKFLRRMNPPRVTIDNESCETATLVKVDSAIRPGILLDVVQMFADLEFSILKAYICSDGGWFMDVFHVTDSAGNKITDSTLLDYITQSIVRSDDSVEDEVSTVGVQAGAESTVIELTGRDRPGLLSEMCALLVELKCCVVAAELWTHNMRVACVIHVKEEEDLGGGPIVYPEKLTRVRESLSNVLKGGGDARDAHTDFTTSVTHTERRLHQLMLANRDYELPLNANGDGKARHLCCEKISVEDCDDRGYSVVNMECKDRPKLLFDTLCALTDLEYVVFHAIVNVDGRLASQEFYIRHRDGSTLKSEAERQRVIQCLRAAIDRRVSEGLRLELCTSDRMGLLSEVTRIFREHGLSVTRADVSTRDEMAVNVFYVTDAAGNPVEPRVINAIREEIGKVEEQLLIIQPSKPLAISPPQYHPQQTTHPLAINDDDNDNDSDSKLSFSIGNLLLGMRTQVLYNLGLIKSSCS